MFLNIYELWKTIFPTSKIPYVSHISVQKDLE